MKQVWGREIKSSVMGNIMLEVNIGHPRGSYYNMIGVYDEVGDMILGERCQHERRSVEMVVKDRRQNDIVKEMRAYKEKRSKD